MSDSHSVTITITRLINAEPETRMACTFIGYPRTATVALTEPLDGRTVINGKTGEERPVGAQ